MNPLLLISLLMASRLAFATAACETHRDLVFDNQDAKVWKTTLCPNQYLPFHTHQHARVAISEEKGRLDVLYKSGKKTSIRLEKGIPVFLSRIQGKALHQDINSGKETLHITVIEMKNS